MRRRLLNLLTALSLLLCVAVVALWVRSYAKADFVGYKPALALISCRGAVWIGWGRWSPGHGFYLRSDAASRWQISDAPWWPFRIGRGSAEGAGMVVIPHWL